MDPVLDNRSESSPSPNRLRIPPSKLPSDESVVFEKSSFFTQPGAPKTLPSLAEVRTAADLQRTKPSDPNCPPPVRFPSLNLLVKYGLEITIAEGQCLWAIRNCLSNIVPVPEVYGWCRDGREVFIYMQLMRGTTLEERWESLTANEKVKICEQLSRMIGALRQLEQEPGDQFVGHIGRQPLLDIVFTSSSSPTAGPFPDLPSFHDWFSCLARPHEFGPDDPPHPMRSGLPDGVPITFTHGDLHRSNIILSPDGEGPPRVLALIDWHQSGWLPAYWEFCKAQYTSYIGEEWAVEYIPRILEPSEAYYYWEYFVLSLGV